MKELLWKTMDQPQPFGGFHLIFFGIIILITFLLIKFFRNCNEERAFRLIVFIAWIFILVMEILKQILWNYDISTNQWRSYNWSSFPFQLCSLPLYLFPLIVFLKDSKVRDLIMVYTSTFIFFGGFGYFFFPVSFCNYVFINFQTMMHHGTQVVIGIFIFVHEYEKFTYIKVLKSTFLLVVSIAVAVLINVIVTPLATINMFELNPLIPTQAPVFSNILNATNYPVFLLTYIVGFLGFASLSYLAIKGGVIIGRKIQKKKD